MLSLQLSLLLQTFAEQTVKGIQENIRTKMVTKYGPMNASGQAAASVKYRLTENGFEIYVSGKAVAYFDTLETGRKPGKQPPKEQLKAWVVTRNIPEKWKVSVDSAVFLVGRKIAREGTNVFQQGGKSGIISEWVSAERVRELRNKAIPLLIEDVTNLILGEFKSNVA